MMIKDNLNMTLQLSLNEEAFNDERDEEEKDDRQMCVSISLSLGEA